MNDGSKDPLSCEFACYVASTVDPKQRNNDVTEVVVVNSVEDFQREERCDQEQGQNELAALPFFFHVITSQVCPLCCLASYGVGELRHAFSNLLELFEACRLRDGVFCFGVELSNLLSFV